MSVLQPAKFLCKEFSQAVRVIVGAVVFGDENSLFSNAFMIFTMWLLIRKAFDLFFGPMPDWHLIVKPLEFWSQEVLWIRQIMKVITSQRSISGCFN